MVHLLQQSFNSYQGCFSLCGRCIFCSNRKHCQLLSSFIANSFAPLDFSLSCTLPRFSFIVCAPSLRPLFLASLAVFHVLPAVFFCDVSCVLCPVSGVLGLVSCALCLGSCAMSPAAFLLSSLAIPSYFSFYHAPFITYPSSFISTFHPASFVIYPSSCTLRQ